MASEIPSTIVEAGAALRNGNLSSVALTSELLSRAKAAQETVSAFMTFTEESALAAAKRADDELASGVDRGPLHGVPLGIKDILATIDAPTTANSRVLDPHWGEKQDATVVKKLRDAGAVILGKLVLHEFAIGWPDPQTGMRFAMNPWDLNRLPGGSSSGTGAAIAAGLILGGLGTDTGGSIRGPAAFCGITGLKPTFGRVSKQGCVPLGYSLDHIGPMARTARDCALMLQVLAGHDPLDHTTSAAPVADYTAGLTGAVSGMRIGVPRTFFFDHPDLNGEIHDATLRAIDLLKEAGAVVREVALSLAPISRVAQRTIMLSEAYAYHQENLQRTPELYGKYTRRAFLEGSLLSGGDIVQAERVRTVVKREVAEAMHDLDVLIMPTGPGLAPVFLGTDPDHGRRAPSFMSIWNLTGQPAISVNAGFSSEGLPIGMQIVGKPFEEATVLQVADAYQQLTDWHTRVPAAASWEALKEPA